MLFIIDYRTAEQAAGEDTDTLVSRPEEKEVIELEGAAEARESTTLGDFQ